MCMPLRSGNQDHSTNHSCGQIRLLTGSVCAEEKVACNRLDQAVEIEFLHKSISGVGPGRKQSPVCLKGHLLPASVYSAHVPLSQ